MKKVFEVLDTKSQADARSKRGISPLDFIGKIEFKKVNFAYPTRKDE